MQPSQGLQPTTYTGYTTALIGIGSSLLILCTWSKQARMVRGYGLP
jgi:hypothetical protein